MPAGEVIALLGSVPELLDSDAAPGYGSWLRELWVRIDGEFDGAALRALMDAPVPQWPRFTITASPVQEEVTAAGEITVPDADAAVPDSAAGRLAQLIYELLGGPRRVAGDPHVSPLPELSEAANRLLCRALTFDAWPNARSFWRDFVAAVTLENHYTRELCVAAGSGERLERGTVCKLTPIGEGVAPIHLVARPRCRIGRSVRQADLITRFLPETPENVERTSELSRVHAVAEISGTGIACATATVLKRAATVRPSKESRSRTTIRCQSPRAVC